MLLDIIKDFKELYQVFRGLDKGFVEHKAGKKFKNDKQTFSPEVLLNHLKGKQKIAQYPLREDGTCHFAAIDLDNPTKCLKQAQKIWLFAQKIDIDLMPEISSSGNNHLWLFFREWVDGWRARRLLTTLVRLAGFDVNKEFQIEIFPKYDFLKPGKWGAAITLPLHGKSVKRGKTILLDWWDELLNEETPSLKQMSMSKKQLDGWIEDWQSPKKNLIPSNMTAEEILQHYDCLKELKNFKKVDEENLWCSCPFGEHEDKKPSCHIFNKALYYHCFGCEQSGFISDIIEEIKGVPWKELTKRDHIEIGEKGIITLMRKGQRTPVADFNMAITQSYQTEDDQRLREITFTQHEKETIAIASAVDLSSKRNFKEFCLKRGTFHFEGTDDELMQIIRTRDEAADIKGVCKLYQSCGFRDIKGFDTTTFATREGKLLFPNLDGIFRTSKETFKVEFPSSLDYLIPFSNITKESLKHPPKTKDELVSIFHSAYPPKLLNYIELSLGWTMALIYEPEIRSQYGVFPILFIGGPNSCGKTALARNLLGLWGSKAIIHIGRTTTYVGLKRMLTTCRGNPCCVDDYRNVEEIRRKDDLFRSTYDQIGGVKGSKIDREIKTEVATAGLMVTGEQAPIDIAFRTRTLMNKMLSFTHKESIKPFNELVDSIDKYTPIAAREIIKKNPDIWQRFYKRIEFWIDIQKRGNITHSRQALTWAIAIAGYEILLEQRITKDFFMKFTISSFDEKEDRESEDMASDFLIMIDTLVGKSEQDRDALVWIDDYFIMSKGLLLLKSYSEIYQKWQIFYRQRYGIAAPPRNALTSELYTRKLLYLNPGKFQKRIKGSNSKWTAIRLWKATEELIPNLLQQFEDEYDRSLFDK
jgi:hypothetical protein